MNVDVRDLLQFQVTSMKHHSRTYIYSNTSDHEYIVIILIHIMIRGLLLECHMNDREYICVFEREKRDR